MSQPSTFHCRQCGRTFVVKADVLARFPGWTPSVCLDCRDGRSRGSARGGGRAASSGKRSSPARGATRTGKARRSASGSPRELGLTLDQVLERFDGGPQDGVFTDGACAGNPGPGGWGLVWVEGGEIRAQRNGSDPQTTNNRMELTALLEAYKLLPEDAQVTIYSDSNLCVQTINQWAAGWQRRGWKRKTGPVQNLDLVRPTFELAKAHPGVTLRWIKAHDGSRWNEYADALATSFQRQEQ